MGAVACVYASVFPCASTLPAAQLSPVFENAEVMGLGTINSSSSQCRESRLRQSPRNWIRPGPWRRLNSDSHPSPAGEGGGTGGAVPEAHLLAIWAYFEPCFRGTRLARGGGTGWFREKKPSKMRTRCTYYWLYGDVLSICAQGSFSVFVFFFMFFCFFFSLGVWASVSF